MKDTSTNFVTIGKIGSTYGIKGWLKIQSYTEFNASILSFKPWYLSKDGQDWHPIEIEDGNLQGDRVFAKLVGYNNPEDARQLTGYLIAIKREQLPALQENEYYWSDLIGLDVIDMQGKVLGKVIYLMETGSNDVLVIKGDKEYAIPYIAGSVIKKIDIQQRIIQVDWELI